MCTNNSINSGGEVHHYEMLQAGSIYPIRHNILNHGARKSSG